MNTNTECEILKEIKSINSELTKVVGTLDKFLGEWLRIQGKIMWYMIMNVSKS